MKLVRGIYPLRFKTEENLREVKWLVQGLYPNKWANQCPGFLTLRLLLIKQPLPHIVVGTHNIILKGSTQGAVPVAQVVRAPCS